MGNWFGSIVSGAILTNVQVIVLIAILVTRLYKPDRIENANALRESLLLLIAAIVMPSFGNFFPAEAASPSDFSKMGLDIGIMAKIFNAVGAVLTGSSLYCLCKSLKS